MPPAGPQAQGWTGKCKGFRWERLAEVEGKGGAYAPITGEIEHQGDDHLDNGPCGGSAHSPVRMDSSSSLFHPLTPYADAAGSPLHQCGETPHPELARSRRARLSFSPRSTRFPALRVVGPAASVGGL
jgi:hypothetical protein